LRQRRLEQVEIGDDDGEDLLVVLCGRARSIRLGASRCRE